MCVLGPNVFFAVCCNFLLVSGHRVFFSITIQGCCLYPLKCQHGCCIHTQAIEFMILALNNYNLSQKLQQIYNIYQTWTQCYASIYYNDVKMGAMASEITSLAIVYSTVYSRRRSKKTSKLRITGLCGGNSPVTGKFPAQMAITAGNVSIWWRHHVKRKRVCSTFQWIMSE